MHSRKLMFALVFVTGIAVGAGSIAWAQAQQTGGTIPGLGLRSLPEAEPAPFVIPAAQQQLTLSNDSLALRVAGKRHGRVVGTLVAKIDGQWVEVQFAPQDSFAR